MRKIRIGFLTRSFSGQTQSFVPLVMRTLGDLGAHVDVVHPPAGAINLSRLRVEHDLYVLRQMSGLAVSLAGALHAEGAAIVNPYPVTMALSDKIVTSRILQAAGVPTPETYVAAEPNTLAPLLEAGPLIVKPIVGSGGHGIRVVWSASELADLPKGEEPAFAQRYHPPQGFDLKMFSIGGRIFGVKRPLGRKGKASKDGEPFTPSPELRDIARRCGDAFGIDLYGVDIIESDGAPYVVDMNTIPGFRGVPDAALLLARYFYAAAERAAGGRPLVESAVPNDAVSTAAH